MTMTTESAIAAGWRVTAGEKTDDRRAKRYRRAIEIHAPDPAAADDVGGRGRTDLDCNRLAERLGAAMRLGAAIDVALAHRVRGVEVSPGWRRHGVPPQVLVRFQVVATSPTAILAENAAIDLGWRVVPLLADLLDQAGAQARERARLKRARDQAQHLIDTLTARVVKRARTRVDFDSRLAALAAEAGEVAGRLALDALDGEASEDELRAYADGTPIEPEARAYVRRVLVERASAEAAQIVGGWHEQTRVTEEDLPGGGS